MSCFTPHTGSLVRYQWRSWQYTWYILIAGDTSQQAVAASKKKSKDLQPPYNVVITGGTKGVAPSPSAVGSLRTCLLFYFLPCWPPRVDVARSYGLTSVCVAGDHVQSVVRELDQLAKSNEGSIQVSLQLNLFIIHSPLPELVLRNTFQDNKVVT